MTANYSGAQHEDEANRGAGWGAAALAAGVVGGAVAGATSPLWGAGLLRVLRQLLSDLRVRAGFGLRARLRL
jgi:hypothetical protein